MSSESRPAILKLSRSLITAVHVYIGKGEGSDVFARIALLWRDGVACLESLYYAAVSLAPTSAESPKLQKE